MDSSGYNDGGDDAHQGNRHYTNHHATSDDAGYYGHGVAHGFTQNQNHHDGSYSNNYQVQGFADANTNDNYGNYSNNLPMGGGAGGGVSYMDPYQSHHMSATAGPTAMDGTNGLLLLTQATQPSIQQQGVMQFGDNHTNPFAAGTQQHGMAHAQGEFGATTQQQPFAAYNEDPMSVNVSVQQGGQMQHAPQFYDDNERSVNVSLYGANNFASPNNFAESPMNLLAEATNRQMPMLSAQRQDTGQQGIFPNESMTAFKRDAEHLTDNSPAPPMKKRWVAEGAWGQDSPGFDAVTDNVKPSDEGPVEEGGEAEEDPREEMVDTTKPVAEEDYESQSEPAPEAGDQSNSEKLLERADEAFADSGTDLLAVESEETDAKATYEEPLAELPPEEDNERSGEVATANVNSEVSTVEGAENEAAEEEAAAEEGEMDPSEPSPGDQNDQNLDQSINVEGGEEIDTDVDIEKDTLGEETDLKAAYDDDQLEGEAPTEGGENFEDEETATGEANIGPSKEEEVEATAGAEAEGKGTVNDQNLDQSKDAEGAEEGGTAMDSGNDGPMEEAEVKSASGTDELEGEAPIVQEVETPIGDAKIGSSNEEVEADDQELDRISGGDSLVTAEVNGGEKDTLADAGLQQGTNSSPEEEAVADDDDIEPDGDQVMLAAKETDDEVLPADDELATKGSPQPVMKEDEKDAGGVTSEPKADTPVFCDAEKREESEPVEMPFTGVENEVRSTPGTKSKRDAAWGELTMGMSEFAGQSDEENLSVASGEDDNVGVETQLKDMGEQPAAPEASVESIEVRLMESAREEEHTAGEKPPPVANEKEDNLPSAMELTHDVPSEGKNVESTAPKTKKGTDDVLQNTTESKSESTVNQNEKPPSVEKEEGDKPPPPTALPQTGVVCLRGKLSKSGGVHMASGVWALGLDTILADPSNSKGLCLDFEYELTDSSDDFPMSGKYSGWFHLNAADGQSKVKTLEKDIDLKFIKNNAGFHNIEGRGNNIYGDYFIIGTLATDGVITMCRKYIPKPKPKRTKKTVSRKPKTSFSGSRRRSSKGGTPRNDTPTKKKKQKMERHPDSGKSYGLGSPGRLCDVCFFEEDGQLYCQTPFIQCLYCGLVAHSACYPPNSTVDSSGKFLCDVCTAYFHPSVNKEDRTKNSEDGNIKPPKPLAEDIEAKSDGRHHKEGIYCQLCARSDVLGGMKPTDSNSWVHIACLMSSETAYMGDKTAVHVQGALKKNRTELMKRKKETGTKPKCEECGGESGMLLKCQHEGCQLYLHGLCAEILDRFRVVETNDQGRDIISYKCTEHSYEGLDSCGVCKLSNKQSEMLECDKCNQGYHMACLTPPLTSVPDGDWFCHNCSTSKSQGDNAEDMDTAEDDEAPAGYAAMDF